MIGLNGHSVLLNWIIHAAVGLILIGVVLALVRLIKGPSLPDRVVSVDLITILSVALAGILSIASDRREFIDVALALALVAFLATVAFAWTLDQRTRKSGSGRSSSRGRKAGE